MQPLRILLSEGSTLSARQTVTVLGRSGHRVDLCDPDPRCLSSWSRYVGRTLRCPAMGEDPEGYLEFVVQHLQTHMMMECKTWNPTGFLQMALPGQQAVEVEHVGSQLTVAVGAALSIL